MSDTSNSLEAIRLISDWGKWLVTIETASIAIVGTFFTTNEPPLPDWRRCLGP
jgi:hypothetical protein